MNKYNHCPICGQWLGWKNWFKFWTTNKPCPACEEEAL